MTPFPAITTVYSYYLPEVRRVVDGLVRDYPHDVFLRSVHPGLDDFHEPILERLVDRHRDDVAGLRDFPWRYATSGSEEGIREVLTTLAVRGVTSIHMLRGDYEGFREVAKTRGIATIEVEADADPRALTPGYFFLSNPSARDGNLLDPTWIEAVLAAGHQVFYDLSYLESTPGARFDLSHPGVFAAVISFSKPFGLFYYRVGFTFAREPIDALYGNKWFKSVFALLLADRVMAEIPRGAIRDRVAPLQREIVTALARDYGLPLRASDAFLLAHIAPADALVLGAEERAEIQRFARADGYRFCLTPLYQERE